MMKLTLLGLMAAGGLALAATTFSGSAQAQWYHGGYGSGYYGYGYGYWPHYNYPVSRNLSGAYDFFPPPFPPYPGPRAASEKNG